MKFLAPLILAGCSNIAFGQLPLQTVPEVSRIGDTVTMDWESTVGLTYFVQYSFDLIEWKYLPVAVAGTGSPLGYGMQTDSDMMFVRLHYTNIPISDVYGSDPDGDGISSWDEIREGGTGTSPLIADTDGDGIRDDGLVYAAVNDPDGAHLTPSLANGLRARWDIQPAPSNLTTYQDTSGNNRHLTRNSLVATTTSEAIISQSCQLSGGYLETDSSALGDLTNFALSLWIRPTEGSLTGANTTYARPIWSYSSSSSLPPMLALAVQNGKTVILRQYSSNTTYQDLGTWTAPEDLDDGQWRHVALVRRNGSPGGTRYHLFINGQEIGNDWGAGGSTLPDTSQGYIRFGNTTLLPGAHHYLGHLDRILIHGRALTDNEVQSLYRADIDQDGLWDITEHRTNLWRDLNADNIRQPSEYNRWLSPYHQDDPAADHDNDGVSSEDEQNSHETNPAHPDSDGDLLPDGWELVHGLDPNNSNDATAHLKSLYVYDADPNDPDSDTDGDGTTDIVEINGPDGDPDTPDGSHPNDTRDGGQPIPVDQRLLINFGVGDKSYSHSEDYVLHVYRIDPETGQEQRYYTLRSGGHGQYDEKVVGVFRKEDTYTFQIDWQSSNLAYSTDPGNPEGADFDYTFKVEPQNDGSGVLIDSYYPVAQYADADSPIGGEKNNVEDFQEKTEPKRIVRLAVDLDIIKPGTEGDTKPVELSEKEEDFVAASGGNEATGGGVVSLNWDDDDQDGGAGGHQQLNFVNDFDDPNGTANEDDLVQLKVHRVLEDNVKGRLKFNANHFRVWKKKDRTDEIKTEDTEFSIKKNKDLILYIEGKKLTAAESPEKVELQVKVADEGTFVKKEEISLHVATPIILCAGWGPEGEGAETSDIMPVFRSADRGLGTKRIDKRRNTIVIKGKDKSGKQLFYQIDIFDPNADPDEVKDVQVRPTSLDKDMKMALSLDGAHVIYSGHSNYGVGPNFNHNGVTTVDDYMNLANFGVAGINIALFKSDLEHGGPNLTIRPADIMGNVNNQQVTIPGGYTTKRFLLNNAIFTKKAAANGNPAYHFKQGNDFITIVGSTGDKPTLKYASCFMNSCSSGRHFGKVLDKKTFFYTGHAAYAVIVEPEAEYNKPSEDMESVFTSYQYIRMLVEGKSWAQIAQFLTDNQFVNMGDTKKQDMYRYNQ